MTKQLRSALAAVLVLSAVSIPAQSTTPTHGRKTTKKMNATEQEIQDLRDMLEKQQAQIDALKQENAEKDQKLRDTQQSAQSAESAANADRSCLVMEPHK